MDRGAELENLTGKERENTGRVLKAAWRRVPISKGRDVIVERGKQGERGADVFKVTKLEKGSDKVDVSKIERQGISQKTYSLDDLRELNSPIKTAREWFNLYYRTTGSSMVRDPGAVDDQLMTMAEFSKNLQGVSYGNADTWMRVVETFQANLAAAKAFEREGTWDVLTDPNYHDPGELTQSKSRDIGRRIIISGGKSGGPSLVFQGRTYAQSEASVARVPDENLWRAYFQVETEDIPRMVAILSEMGQKEAANGRVMDFKFLLATWLDGKVPFKVGEFPGLTDQMPRIAMYFRSEQERREFLQRLVDEHRQEMHEMSRKRAGKARRPGADVIFDSQTGEELRHINVLRVPGFSESFIGDNRDWRESARGGRTTGV